MPPRRPMIILATLACLCCCFAAVAPAVPVSASSPAAPPVIGETWTIVSTVLGETRRINVYAPPDAPPGRALPLLLMPDGGLREDFLHVAGLLQGHPGDSVFRLRSRMTDH